MTAGRETPPTGTERGRGIGSDAVISCREGSGIGPGAGGSGMDEEESGIPEVEGDGNGGVGKESGGTVEGTEGVGTEDTEGSGGRGRVGVSFPEVIDTTGPTLTSQARNSFDSSTGSFTSSLSDSTVA